MLLTLRELPNEICEHKDGEREVVQPSEGFSKPLIVSGQSAKAGCPGKASFHHPAARQQDKSLFGFSMFNHFQSHAVLLCRLDRVVAGISLIDIGQLDGVTGNLLHCFG